MASNSSRLLDGLHQMGGSEFVLYVGRHLGPTPEVKKTTLVSTQDRVSFGSTAPEQNRLPRACSRPRAREDKMPPIAGASCKARRGTRGVRHGGRQTLENILQSFPPRISRLVALSSTIKPRSSLVRRPA